MIKLKKPIIICGIVAIVLAAGITVAIIRTNSIPQFEPGYNETKDSVELKTYSGTLNEWVMTIEDESIAEMVEKQGDEEKTGEIGTPIKLFYFFEGRKPGRTKVHFKYVVFAEGSVDEEKTYLIEVDQAKHIKVTEQ